MWLRKLICWIKLHEWKIVCVDKDAVTLVCLRCGLESTLDDEWEKCNDAI